MSCLSMNNLPSGKAKVAGGKFDMTINFLTRSLAFYLYRTKGRRRMQSGSVRVDLIHPNSRRSEGPIGSSLIASLRTIEGFPCTLQTPCVTLTGHRQRIVTPLSNLHGLLSSFFFLLSSLFSLFTCSSLD